MWRRIIVAMKKKFFFICHTVLISQIGGRFFISKSLFQSAHLDLYNANALNDVGLLESGSYVYYRNQTKYTKNIEVFTSSIQEVLSFLT